MHILLTNDDGPPSNQSSPYVHSLVCTLQDAGHTVSVVLPHTQRSWIGKAHMVGQTLTPTYFRPGTLHQDDGITQDRPFNDGKEEWVLLDGTPASCTQIGLWHLFNDKGPIDVIVSGPNYGRNTTAVFALSSGTLGGALEGATMGKRSIALSYAFDSRDHDPKIIAAASRVSTRLIEKFVKEWPEDVHLYSINVPLREGVEDQLITYTEMIQNKWTSGSSYTVLKGGASDADPDTEELKIRDKNDTNNSEKAPVQRDHVTFKWSPNFSDVKDASQAAGKGDGWHVLQGHVTVTPLRANFWHLPQYAGEIKLNDPKSISSANSSRPTPLLAIVKYPESYVQPLIVSALQKLGGTVFEITEDDIDLQDTDRPCLQFRAYESLDFEHAMQHRTTSQVCAYVIRKALIRKHYLSNTVAAWLTKHPDSRLRHHFKAGVHFELDYAEFLDDALVDAWDLNESMARNEDLTDSDEKEWWILKPGMSDGGNGIRLFSSLEELQSIFEEWDPPSDDEEEVDEASSQTYGEDTQREETLMTSQLRHFVVQPYIDPPLLLPAYGNRKFHIRCYILAVGALKVYVYREMLALFAAEPYTSPTKHESSEGINLQQHLTNTCFQEEATKDSSVHRFWDLGDSQGESTWQEKVFSDICNVVGEVFEAAAREQMVHFQAIPNAFEIFGVDFLVDASHNVWLLEMNAYPDFKQTGQGLQTKVVGGLFACVVRCAVAPFFGIVTHEEQDEQMVLARDLDLGRL